MGSLAQRAIFKGV